MLWSYSTPFKLFCSAQKVTCFHKYLNWTFFGKLYICTDLKEKKDEGYMCILLYGIIKVSFITEHLENVFEGNTLSNWFSNSCFHVLGVSYIHSHSVLYHNPSYMLKVGMSCTKLF